MVMSLQNLLLLVDLVVEACESTGQKKVVPAFMVGGVGDMTI